MNSPYYVIQSYSNALSQIGKYIAQNYEGGQWIGQLISVDGDSSSWTMTVNLVALCELVNIKFTYTYSQGSTLYGTIETENGALPETGTLIEGSTTGKYCVLEIDGDYYYYVKVADSSSVVWDKWSCEVAVNENSTYTETSESVGEITIDSLSVDDRLYKEYGFYYNLGFLPIGSAYLVGNNNGDITDWIVGYYIVYETKVYKIISLDNENGDVTCEIVAACDVETVKETIYSQGSETYGTIEVKAEGGALPEEGTLIEGSAIDRYYVLEIDGTYYYYTLADGYCVLEIDGTYYYYTLLS